MADRDGITGTFYWTPPSGDIPPVTITISSTVPATGRIDTTPTPEAPKEPIPEELPKPPEEAPRIPKETPKTLQPSQGALQIAPQETPKAAVPNTPPVVNTQPESTNVVPRPSHIESPAPTTSPATTFTTLISSTWITPTTPSSSLAPVIPTPQSHTTKLLTISLASSGAALAAAFIAVMLYTQYRRNKALSRRAAIKSQIGYPMAPPPPQPPPMQQVFPHDIKTRKTEEPIAPLSFGTRTRTRAVSSVYGDQALHARDTIGNFSGTPYNCGDMFLGSEACGPFGPDTDSPPPPPPPPPPLYPRSVRNLMVSRRSSLFSNYRPQVGMEEHESWGELDGIGEGDEGVGMGETWEAQRRRIFEE